MPPHPPHTLPPPHTPWLRGPEEEERRAKKRSHEEIDSDNLGLVQASEERKDRLRMVAVQWLRVLELITMAESNSHGSKKPEDVTWRAFMEDMLGERLQDPPAWLNTEPAEPFLEMLPRFTALLAKAQQAAEKAAGAYRRAQARAEKSQARHHRHEEAATKKLMEQVDVAVGQAVHEDMKTFGLSLIGNVLLLLHVCGFHVSLLTLFEL